MLLKVFVFPSLSLQFNFPVHPCILISQDLLLIIIFFQNINLYPFLSLKRSVHETYISSPSICSFPYLLSFLQLFSISQEGSSYRSEVECYITSCLDCLSRLLFHFGLYTILGLLSFCLISRAFFLYLIYLLVKQSVKNELEKSMVFTKIS